MTHNLAAAICITAGTYSIIYYKFTWWALLLIIAGICMSEYHDNEANRLGREKLRLQNTQLQLQNAHQEMTNNALRRKLKL